MAEFDSEGRPIISVIRVIEYHGTEEWVKAVIAASRIPWMGKITSSPPNSQGKVMPFPEKCFILSGQVNWSETLPEEEERRPLIPVPPGSSSKPS